MKQSNSVSLSITLLRAFLLTTIDCVLSPASASCLLVAAMQWINSLWLPFVGAWREF
jgi:hypothetical protein